MPRSRKASQPAVRITATATLHLDTTEALYFIKQALFDATEEVVGFDTVATAKQLCPILPTPSMERYPGELRDSISSKVSKVKNGVRASVFTETDAEWSSKNSSGKGYGGFVELGTKKMGAQPFIFPAFEQNIGRLPGIVQEALATYTGGKGEVIPVKPDLMEK
jgi:HK97 gp10 family phage protein